MGIDPGEERAFRLAELEEGAHDYTFVLARAGQEIDVRVSIVALDEAGGCSVATAGAGSGRGVLPRLRGRRLGRGRPSIGGAGATPGGGQGTGAAAGSGTLGSCVVGWDAPSARARDLVRGRRRRRLHVRLR